MLHLFVRWKKRPLDRVPRITPTRMWKGNAHEYPIRSTLQPAAVPEWVDACGSGGAAWCIPQGSRCGAPHGDDDAQAVPVAESLFGTDGSGGRPSRGRRVLGTSRTGASQRSCVRCLATAPAVLPARLAVAACLACICTLSLFPPFSARTAT